MNNTFGDTLRSFREQKFPGQSLRKVGEYLVEQHNFKDYFYTQLNKIEMGVILPSSGLLGRILEAYGVTKEEREDIFHTYSAQSAAETLRVTAEDLKVRLSLADNMLAGMLLRKSKKSK